MENSLNYVRGVYDDRITLTINDQCLRKKIKIIGGKRYLFTRNAYEIKIENEQHKFEMLQKLIDMELYFVGGEYGWPPASIAHYYREKGLLSGKIKQITWAGPGKPIFREI
jgi:hypothetical protein